jgi:hypothetical protein
VQQLREARSQEQQAAADAAAVAAVEERSALEAKSAIAIQAGYRGYQGRQQVQQLREACHVTQGHAVQPTRLSSVPVPSMRSTRAQSIAYGFGQDDLDRHEPLAVSEPTPKLPRKLPSLPSDDVEFGFDGQTYSDQPQVLACVLKVQALWRGYVQRKRFHRLTMGPASVPTVKEYLHVLRDNEDDCKRQVAVLQAKSYVMVKVEQVAELEKNLAYLDAQIGQRVKKSQAHTSSRQSAMISSVKNNQANYDSIDSVSVSIFLCMSQTKWP